MMTGKILITGGTGTLGKAILRRAHEEHWDAEFTVYSRNELRQAQLKAEYRTVKTVLGDVRDYDHLSAAIAGHDVVLHLAAMKQIPTCEAQPDACIATNVIGSQNVVRASLLHGVKRCIGVSTDKAAASITFYGASKKMLEGLLQVHSNDRTTFACVRYGNVVASNGSVIPLWRKQAAEGKAIEVTDPRCTRFWMSPDDAVAVLVKAMETPAGSILVPLMSALSIEDMAAIIAPGCQIKKIGLRSYEKLHEDLVHPDEKASVQGDWCLLGQGQTGLSYTSINAPKLHPDEFLRMVKEAEQYE